jgi:hypothetical protein
VFAEWCLWLEQGALVFWAQQGSTAVHKGLIPEAKFYKADYIISLVLM